jgi:hypothetical protein
LQRVLSESGLSLADATRDPGSGQNVTVAEESNRVEVSRRIEASAALIFKILADPQRHIEFDGSGMLRGAVLDSPISDVGDTFTMKMHRLGDDYLMINYVVEFEPDRRICAYRTRSLESETSCGSGGTPCMKVVIICATLIPSCQP